MIGFNLTADVTLYLLDCLLLIYNCLSKKQHEKSKDFLYKIYFDVYSMYRLPVYTFYLCNLNVMHSIAHMRTRLFILEVCS